MPIWRTTTVAGTLIAIAIGAASCGGDEEPARPQEKAWTSLIDEDRAWADLVAFAAIGGVSHARGGEAGLNAGRALIKERLTAAGYVGEQLIVQSFSQRVPTDKTGKKTRRVTMENIVGVLPGARPEAIAIAAHYDTKILRGVDFCGANDGGSGVAVTLEMARQLRARAEREGPPPFTLMFVLFDGEEAFFDWGLEHAGGVDNCYGSRYMAARKDEFPIETLLLVDLVGDKDLDLAFETNSHRDLRSIFLDASQEFFGIDIFGKPQTILDDHIPFKEAGMNRVIDLIDFNYGPRNSFWHSEHDTVENCSSESLSRVGSLVLTALPKVEAWLSQKL